MGILSFGTIKKSKNNLKRSRYNNNNKQTVKQIYNMVNLNFFYTRKIIKAPAFPYSLTHLSIPAIFILYSAV